MSNKLTIKITAEGTQGRVDIIGVISEWTNNNSVEFRGKCQELKDAGAEKCHVYLNTYGGNCFEANEIVNILEDIFGSYTAEGGSVVASAGTYIMVKASYRTLAKNSQFMIHKPSGSTYGTEDDVDRFITLLRNLTEDYYESYIKVIKKPVDEFKEKWNAGDFWLTAQQAKEWGFIDEVKGTVKVDKATALAIQACGSPIPFSNEYIIQTKNTDMNLTAIVAVLGMPRDSTEEQVQAQIVANTSKAKKYDQLKADVEAKAKADRTAKVTTLLDAAVKDKRIKADARGQWEEMFADNFNKTEALLDTMEAVEPLSAHIKANGGSDVSASTYKGKTFEEWQDEDPSVLAELQQNKPDVFNGLFAAYEKKNNLKY